MSGRDDSEDSPERVVADGSTGDVGLFLRRGAKRALARWVLTQRQRGAQPRGGNNPHDEATHAWDGRRRFAEDYTFCAVQPDLGIVARLEWLPGRDSNRLWLTLLRDGDAFALPGGQSVLRIESNNRWRAGGMVLDCLTPFLRWTVRYAGAVEAIAAGGPGPSDLDGRATGNKGKSARVRCSVDLTFTSVADPYTPGSDDDPDLLSRRLGQASWDRGLLRAVRRVTNRGYVQVCAVEGTIALGDTLIPVRARGLRQHFWGVRDWGASDHGFHCFLAAADGSIAWVHHARFPFVTMEGGFSGPSAGAVVPITGLDVTWERRPWRAPVRASLELRTAQRSQRVELSMRTDSAFVVDGRGLVELGLVRAEGPNEGWGIWGGQRRWLPRR